MINFIWIGILLTGIVFAVFTGRMDQVTEALFDSAGEAVTLCISLLSVLVFWLGLMRIAQQSGLLKKLSGLCRPLVARLFPDVPPEHPAMGYMLSNMIANLFGLGNAATPMGIKAMEQLRELNGGSDSASRPMITFLALNNSSIELIPTSVIAIRILHDAASPADIAFPAVISTAAACMAALLLDRLFWARQKRKGRVRA